METTRRLSSRDESDLSWYHTLARGDVSAIKAQSYDPRTGGDQNDNLTAIARVLSQRSMGFCMRYRAVERARTHLIATEEGADFWGWLEVAYREPTAKDPHGLFPEHPVSGRVLFNNANPHPAASLARHTPAAQAAAVKICERQERERLIGLTYEYALASARELEGDSRMSLVEAVLERERMMTVKIEKGAILKEAARLVWEAASASRRDPQSLELCEEVRTQAMEMWAAAGSSFVHSKMATLPPPKLKEAPLPSPKIIGRGVYRDLALERAARDFG